MAEMFAKLFRRQHAEGPSTRDFDVPLAHGHGHGHKQHFVGNSIRTAKYSLLSFFPLVLLDQFRRLANVYFLIISVIQLSTDLSPTNRFSTILPLMGVIIVSIIKEAYEDYGRHQADRKVNGMPVTKLARPQAHGQGHAAPPAGNANWIEAQCRDLHVADIVLVKDGDVVPADLLLLASAKSCAYVDTASLDGETNLKMKSPVGPTAALGQGQELEQLGASITCDLPNPRLYSFSGLLKFSAPASAVSYAAAHSHGAEGGAGAGVPVANDHVLLRGMVLRNTGWAVGLVVYTGGETKIQLNARDPPRKRSRLERQLDGLVALIFALLAVLCTITAVGYGIWTSRLKAAPFYLPYIASLVQNSAELIKSSGLTWVTSLLLFNNLLPISLIVTLELAKFAQARAIDNDQTMVQRIQVERVPGQAPEEVVIPARARTSNLNESLGQIQYIVTDKTGTLTQNLMTLRAVSIGGTQYGKGSAGAPEATSEDKGKGSRESRDRSRSSRNEAGAESPSSGPVPFDKELGRVLADSTSPGHEAAVAAALCLALCHTVQVGESLPGAPPAYQAASPDEGALVSAARGLGYELCRRSDTSITLTLRSTGEERTYSVLAVNEFSSVRKRMSIVLKDPSGRYLMYCKGADSAMVSRLGKGAGAVKRPHNHAAAADGQGEGRVHSMPSVGLHHTMPDGAANFVAAAVDATSPVRDHVIVTPLTSARSDGGAPHERHHSGFGPEGEDGALRGGVPAVPRMTDMTGVLTSPTAGDRDSGEKSGRDRDAEIASLSLLQRHLDGFATGGLRTLVLAKRELTEAEAGEVLAVHRAASAKVVGREEALEEAADAMEVQLSLVGATGIEDKLQDDVAKTIAALSGAGIRFVMCTGDKTETAINIGLSCALLAETSDLVVLKSKDMDTNVASLAAAKASLQDRGKWAPGMINPSLALVIEGHALHDLLEAIKVKPGVSDAAAKSSSAESDPAARVQSWPKADGDKKTVARRLSNAWTKTAGAIGDAMTDAVGRLFPAAAEITGADGQGGAAMPGSDDADDVPSGPPPPALLSIPKDPRALKAELLDFMQQCRSVICCRVSPLQKADVVNLIQGGVSPRPLVLAVGDGGNDVSMIQAADIGVGISGVEGQAAVQASDYAIGAFRFLGPLLLVHGRYNYRRVALAINYSIYKNMVLVFSLWAYSVEAGWSGTSLFESYVSSMWNLLFTSLPILSVAIADKDVTPWAAMTYPFVYHTGQRNAHFSASAVAGWMVTAVLHSLIAGVVIRLSFLDVQSTSPVGHGADLYTDGCAVHFTLVVLVTAKLAMQLHSWHWHTYTAVVVSLLLWLGFVGVYSTLYAAMEISAVADIYGVAGQLFSRPAFWLTVPIAVASALCLDVAVHLGYRYFMPDLTAVVQEWSSGRAAVKPVPLDTVLRLSGAPSGAINPVTSDRNRTTTTAGANLDALGHVGVPMPDGTSGTAGDSAASRAGASRINFAEGSAMGSAAGLSAVYGTNNALTGSAAIAVLGKGKRASVVYANNMTADQAGAAAAAGTVVVRAGVTGEVFDSDVSGRAALAANVSALTSGNQRLVADLLSGLTRVLKIVRMDIRTNEVKIQRKLAQASRMAQMSTYTGESALSPMTPPHGSDSAWVADVLPARVAGWFGIRKEPGGQGSVLSLASYASLPTGFRSIDKNKDPSAAMVLQSDPSAVLVSPSRLNASSGGFNSERTPGSPGLMTGATPHDNKPLTPTPIVMLAQQKRNRRLSARFRSFVSKAVTGTRMGEEHDDEGMAELDELHAMGQGKGRRRSSEQDHAPLSPQRDPP